MVLRFQSLEVERMRKMKGNRGLSFIYFYFYLFIYFFILYSSIRC